MNTVITINQEGTEAIVQHSGLPPFTLSHDQGKVLELVAWYLSSSNPKLSLEPVATFNSDQLELGEDTIPIYKAA